MSPVPASPPFCHGVRIADAGPRAEAPQLLRALGRALCKPATSLTGMLDLLADGALGVLPDMAAPLLDRARHHGHQLAQLAEDVLLLGEFGAGGISLRLQSIDLTALIRAVIAAEARRDHARGMRFAFTTSAAEARIYADPRWLASAIARPLAHAVRATGPGGLVSISLRPRGAFFRVTCRDPGAADGEMKNTDLGFGIAAAILDRHGGKLIRSPHSAPGMVHIELPEWQALGSPGDDRYKRASSLTRTSTCTGFCR